MFKFRAIKPKTFKKAIFRDEIIDEAYSLAADILLEYELTTATWEHQPHFVHMVDIGSDGVSILVGTDDRIYGYVNRGTPPHMIYPKKPGGVLAFRSGYSAKTSPNTLGSRAGGPSGGMVYARGVPHPGTEPRNFDTIIDKEWTPEIQRRMKNAVARAVYASGHAI